MRRAHLFIMGLLPAFVVLVLAEAGLRYSRAPTRADPLVGSGGRLHKPSHDPTLIYELVPGAQTVRDGVAIAINSAGFRDDEFPATLPDEAYRIVVLGDSVAWGWGVPMAAAFPQALERQLHERRLPPRTSPIVYNLAVDGYSTAQEIRLLETRGLALQPSLVLLSYVLNDPDTRDGGLAQYYASRMALVALGKDALTPILDRLHGYPREYHHLIHARYRDQTITQFRHLGQISRDRQVPILVVLSPVFRFKPEQPYPWQDLHDFIRSLCEANALAFLDLYASFRGRDAAAYAYDVWHPTSQGHALIAQAIVEYLAGLPVGK
jgi:lysophospholipase L1-like esterase